MLTYSTHFFVFYLFNPVQKLVFDIFLLTKIKLYLDRNRIILWETNGIKKYSDSKAITISLRSQNGIIYSRFFLKISEVILILALPRA